MLENGFLHTGLASNKRADTSQKLRHVKGFRKIVVRAEIQSFDAVLNGVPRTKDEDHFLKAVATPLTQEFQATPIWQADIEND